MDLEKSPSGKLKKKNIINNIFCSLWSETKTSAQISVEKSKMP